MRIGFGEREHLAQRLSEHAFRLCLGGRALGTHGAISRGDNALERIFFVPRVTLHRFHEVGNQVVAALQLNVNVGPRVVRLHAQSDQAVVHTDDDEDEKNDNRKRCVNHDFLRWVSWTGKPMHELSRPRIRFVA